MISSEKTTRPIFCINGDLYPTQKEKNRKIHPDFDAVIVPHTGHYPMLEKPGEFNRRLAKFLAKITTKK